MYSYAVGAPCGRRECEFRLSRFYSTILTLDAECTDSLIRLGIESVLRMRHLIAQRGTLPSFAALFDVPLLHGRCVGVNVSCAADAADAQDTTAGCSPLQQLLHPLEWSMAQGMRGARQHEFGGGRLALRRAVYALPGGAAALVAPATAGNAAGKVATAEEAAAAAAAAAAASASTAGPPLLQAPLLACAGGAPLLPRGITGSISHKAGIAVALAAAAAGDQPGTTAAEEAATTTVAQRRAVGVDIELVVASADEGGRFARRVLTARERTALGGDPALVQALLLLQQQHPAAAVALSEEAEGTRRRKRALALALEAKLAFSLKEALFKALYPFVGRRVALREAEVGPRADGSCAVRLVGREAVEESGIYARPGPRGQQMRAAEEDLAHLSVELEWGTLSVDGELYFLSTACVEAGDEVYTMRTSGPSAKERENAVPCCTSS